MSTSPGTAAVLRSEARLFGRELGSLFWIVVFPTALLCILGAIPSFREPGEWSEDGLRVIDFYVPTSILLSMVLAAIMAMPPVVFAYREGGVLRRLRTTPVGPSAILIAQVMLHAAAVLASSVLVFVVGAVAFDTPLPESWAGYLLAYLLAVVAAFSIGAVVTAVTPNARVGTAIGTIVFFPAMFTAGVWVPIQALPDTLRTVLGFTPLSAASEAMTDAMAGGFPDLSHLAVVAAWGAVLSLIAVRTFRWE